MARVIVLATGKGGAGKSTLARALAGHWSATGHKVAIVDADPQASIAGLHDSEGPMSQVTVVEDAEQETVQGTIQDLVEDHSVVIVDTAGFRNTTSISAILVADMVVIPLKASAEDLREAVEMQGLVAEISQVPERNGIPLQTAMILTMTTRGTLIARQVRKELLGANIRVLDNELIHRVAYPEASARGLSPSISEPSGAAARDIARIAAELNEMKDENDGIKGA